MRKTILLPLVFLVSSLFSITAFTESSDFQGNKTTDFKVRDREKNVEQKLQQSKGEANHLDIQDQSSSLKTVGQGVAVAGATTLGLAAVCSSGVSIGLGLFSSCGKIIAAATAITGSASLLFDQVINKNGTELEAAAVGEVEELQSESPPEIEDLASPEIPSLNGLEIPDTQIASPQIPELNFDDFRDQLIGQCSTAVNCSETCTGDSCQTQFTELDTQKIIEDLNKIPDSKFEEIGVSRVDKTNEILKLVQDSNLKAQAVNDFIQGNNDALTGFGITPGKSGLVVDSSKLKKLLKGSKSDLENVEDSLLDNANQKSIASLSPEEKNKLLKSLKEEKDHKYSKLVKKLQDKHHIGKSLQDILNKHFSKRKKKIKRSRNGLNLLNSKGRPFNVFERTSLAIRGHSNNRDIQLSLHESRRHQHRENSFSRSAKSASQKLFR